MVYLNIVLEKRDSNTKLINDKNCGDINEKYNIKSSSINWT